MTARIGRTAIAALLTVGVMAALLGSWFASGWRGVRAEQRAIRAEPRVAAERTARELAAALDDRLDELRRREDARPYFHYQNLFHDPRGASEGDAVVPSPLSGGPDDPLVAAHFQIDAGGRVSLPTLNDAVPELNATMDLADNVRLRDTIASAGDTLRVGDDPVAVAMADPVQAPRVEVLQQQEYLQNRSADEVYQSAKSPRQDKRPSTPQPGGEDPVAITVAPLDWRAVTVGGAPALAALRRVDTPDGALTQGFVIQLDAARAFVADREPAATISLRVDEPDGARPGAPLALSDGAWRVTVDDAPAMHDADARAAGVGGAFLGRFVPTAVLATSCAALVVLLVARAERTARQRAQFAAAAAHELRTPLAGLQLYGDMLADGLGNPERASDYARRMSEEAARLGRVVSNVLDFSHLERGNLSVNPRPGDAAEVVAAAVERARPALDRAGATLRLELPDGPLPAILDADALARILGNLLDNAEKYGRGADDRSVVVSAARAGDLVTISVRDAGPGIGAGQQAQRLFRPFERGTAPDGPPGLGLGLALSRSLARAMGGDLEHRPAPGGGATFVVSLRTEKAPTDSARRCPI